MTIEEKLTIKSIFLEHPILFKVFKRKIAIPKMVMNEYLYVFYAIAFIFKFFQSFFQHSYAHVDRDFMLASVVENRSVFHDYIDSFKAVGKKLLPRCGVFFFLRRENRTQHQKGNQAQGENFCFHLITHKPIRISPLFVKYGDIGV